MFKKLISLMLCIAVIAGCVPAMAASKDEAKTEPTIEEQMVSELLAAQVKKQKDVWVLAILQAGAQDIAVKDGKLCFSLCSFQPELQDLGAYSKASDKVKWRKAALKTVADYDLKFEMELTKAGQVGDKARNDFINTVKKAANNAKKALASKDIASAIEDMLFCEPVSAKKVTADTLKKVTKDFKAFIKANKKVLTGDAVDWAPLFYAQRKLNYSIAKGPRALTLSWSGVTPEQLINGAYDALVAELAGKTEDERPALADIPALWKTKLAETSVSLANKKLTAQKITFDILDLAANKLPKDYKTYVAGYKPEEKLQKLTDNYENLPGRAADKMPKTGSLSVPVSKGTTVTVEVPANGRNTYVQLRDADAGDVVADAFIAPGKRVKLRAPMGSCKVLYASGAAWYGTETLFGALGDYTMSTIFQVGKKAITLTAGEEQEGFMLQPASSADFLITVGESFPIAGTLKANIPEGAEYPDNNPVIEGVSSTTGLPASGETFTPTVVVIDNAELAYPHWGVAQADVIFQVPNASGGATKLLALFADHYPKQAGPLRSARATMIPAARIFGAAFVHAGGLELPSYDVNFIRLLADGKLTKGKRYDMLGGNMRERISGYSTGHDLSSHVSEIHEDLIKKNAVFEERPFLFTDEPRTNGEEVSAMRVMHLGESFDSSSNPASQATFNYDEKLGGYTRTNSSGLYTDRDTKETVVFANVLVMRANYLFRDGYMYFQHQLAGSGCLEIFQNGHYVRGSWMRKDADGRLILIDEDGSELKLQRGKTFIVLTNEYTDVRCIK